MARAALTRTRTGGDETPDILDDPRWEVFGLLREAYWAVSGHLDAAVTAAGDLDPSMADLVFRLARTPGNQLRAVDITQALSTSTTRTTRLLDRAVELGLVTRAPHPDDRRATQVTLTPAGLSDARRLGVVALDAAQARMYDFLSVDEATQLVRLLRAVRDAEPTSGGQDPGD